MKCIAGAIIILASSVCFLGAATVTASAAAQQAGHWAYIGIAFFVLGFVLLFLKDKPQA